MYYNIYVAEAVTRQGRSYISCSMMFFEQFLANNVKFNSLNEIITFIHNIVTEKDKRTLSDDLILDRDITLEEAFFKVMNTIDGTVWMPTEKEMVLVWEYMRGLGKEDLNRIYYKNNLYTFCELPVIQNIIVNILCNLKGPFMNPNEPPKEIKEDIDNLTLILKEYVYYPYFPIDKLDRIEYMQRDVVVITDRILSLYYRNIVSKISLIAGKC